MGWIALYQDMVSNIADAKLSYEEYRVFLKLLSKVDFENYLTVSQKKLSTELNMKQPNIARAIKGLCERQIITSLIKVKTAIALSLTLTTLVKKSKDHWGDLPWIKKHFFV